MNRVDILALARAELAMSDARRMTNCLSLVCSQPAS